MLCKRARFKTKPSVEYGLRKVLKIASKFVVGLDLWKILLIIE